MRNAPHRVDGHDALGVGLRAGQVAEAPGHQCAGRRDPRHGVPRAAITCVRDGVLAYLPGRIQSSRVDERPDRGQGKTGIAFDVTTHQLATGQRPFGESRDSVSAGAFERQIQRKRGKHCKKARRGRSFDRVASAQQRRGGARAGSRHADRERHLAGVQQGLQRLVIKVEARMLEDVDRLQRLGAGESKRERKLQSGGGTTRLPVGHGERFAQQLYAIGIACSRSGGSQLEQQRRADRVGRWLAHRAPQQVKRCLGCSASHRETRGLS